MKTCSGCLVSKAEVEFYKDSSKVDKLSTRCKTCKNSVVKIWQATNLSKVRSYKLKYKKAHPESRNKYERKRAQRDASFKLNRNFSKLVWQGLRRNKSSKGGKGWKELVGYDLATLKQHLESQFIEGMTWDNYGKGGWVIDHIKPVCSFTLLQFNNCWALDNLRPLWEIDNLKKSAQDLKLKVRDE